MKHSLEKLFQQIRLEQDAALQESLRQDQVRKNNYPKPLVTWTTWVPG
jgi:hypothetical protein